MLGLRKIRYRHCKEAPRMFLLLCYPGGGGGNLNCHAYHNKTGLVHHPKVSMLNKVGSDLAVQPSASLH